MKRETFPEAVECYKRAMSINISYAEACYNLGNTFRDSGNPDSAISIYKSVIQFHPTFYQAYNNLGNVFERQR